MKLYSFYKWIIASILPFLFFSCNSDESFEDYASTIEESVLSRPGMLLPSNILNPYDSVGSLHNDILEIYLSEYHNPATIEDIDDEIQSLIRANAIITDSLSLILPEADTIIAILDSPYVYLPDIMDSSDLTNNAKIQFTDFIDDLLLISDEEYEDIYEFIVLYEASVFSDVGYTHNDKRIILTVTAIIRYSFYYGKGRKDKDWETSVGNIVAGTKGALEDSISAIRMALVAGLYGSLIISS